ncbi:MAG: hypothetical protein ABIC04_03365 [Nanoarchaeota archaeon]
MEEENDKNNLWAEGAFIESVGPDDAGKIRTFHMEHDEEVNYNCKRCDKKISAHNRDWHDGMCDKCFNDKHFSGEDEIPEEMEKEIEAKLKNFKPEDHSVLDLCKEIGTSISAINDSNTESFMPLLMAIEETIWRHYSEDDSLKDTDIIESLKNIRNNIFSNDTKFSEMENEIITRIKVVLMVNNYDKRDLSLSISKVLKSAKMHKSMGGSRGYLNFLSNFFKQMG